MSRHQAEVPDGGTGALSGLRYGAVGRPDKRSAIRQRCRMAAQVPYPAYGMVLPVGLISVAPSGRNAGWRHRRLIRPTIWGCR
ncbi:hypothetical protein AM352_08530 [Citrobacter koseri]|nr:hypothetical protein AM352_08530 [Citrobacter koseri]PWY12299.1 hypothetical protein DL345_23080 [Citrobacter koseri]